MMISAAAISSVSVSRLRAAALCYPTVLSHQALARRGLLLVWYGWPEDERVQSRTRLPLRLDKVREVLSVALVPSSAADTMYACLWSLYLLVHQAVIPNQRWESRALGRPDL